MLYSLAPDPGYGFAGERYMWFDVLRGRIWVLVLLVTLLAPPWAARRL